MNLAVRDIRHNLGRFAFTTVGIGLLLMIVMGMGGIYRGLIYEATLLVDRVGADLWVVQGSTRGPFAEISRISASLEDRVRAVPGGHEPGVEAVEVDLQSGRVRIDGDAENTALIAALNGAGYPAQLTSQTTSAAAPTTGCGSGCGCR